MELDITDFFNTCEPKYYAASRAELGDDAFGKSRFADAARLFESLILADTLPEWLTVPASAHL